LQNSIWLFLSNNFLNPVAWLPIFLELSFMQDSCVTKNELTGATTPRVNVITTGNSIVVLVVAGGEGGGLSSYTCPIYTKNLDQKAVGLES